MQPYPFVRIITFGPLELLGRAETEGEDALALWEEAYRLALRGPFLADELYSEWAKERRALLAGHYRQCVHEMTRLYRERGARAGGRRRAPPFHGTVRGAGTLPGSAGCLPKRTGDTRTGRPHAR